MNLWLTDVLSPVALLHHVALFLIVVAIAMPTIALVRWLALAAGVVGGVATIALGYNATEGFWWALLVVVALLRVVLASNWRMGGRLSDEAQMFHERAVPGLNAGQVRRLLAVGRWREVVPGTVLTKTGERIAELVFVVRGQVDIVVDGRKIAEVGPGSLVGETGISTGEAAMATAVCATPVRYLGFEAGRLYRLLDSHAELQDAVELAVERSLREKLNRSNLAAAHGERPPR
ncbi:MAG TPA: cyclic nucleotide-binding domain-containing protein [Bauldia sp.]|nr:cyclic nucleotide-binding domain-containing protein [Bauldia sp.]